MSEKITYYKVIGSDNKSCHGGDFDWTEYLPENGKPGKWTPEIDDIVECSRGYHITRYWNMWYLDGCQIFECDFEGPIESSAVGVIAKGAVRRVRLVRKFNPTFTKSSTGSYNTGNSNTGDRNTGNRNTGDRNTGYRNTGDCNTGSYNTGNSNAGDSNTGSSNTGDSNTGDSNTGNHNTGSSNTGYRNTGDHNTGSYNTGDWNKASNCTGHFNTVTPDTIMVFNKPCTVDKWEKSKKPWFIFFQLTGTYKESWRKAYDGASVSDKLLLVQLPNFDADVFYEISGIRVDQKTGKELEQ